MSILNWYQLALIATIVGTIWLSNFARRQMASAHVQVAETSPRVAEPSPLPIDLNAVKERLRQLIPQPTIEERPTVATEVPPQIGPPKPVEPVRPAAMARDMVKERIRHLDKLFDDNVLSVEEYVELRKRVTG